jgi:subtilisin family serine protease
VVDTGVEARHPDLQGSVVKTANFVEGGERTFALDRHGTAVVGVIAARAGNDVGIAGIAPEAEIVAAKACWHRTAGAEDALCSSWTLAKAVDFAILERVHVVNLSLAGPPDPLLGRLIVKAVGERAITVVAAVMEAGEQAPGFPASLPAVIAVLASDHQGRIGAVARVTRHPLLAAPGIEILTTVPRDTYDFLSGSSLAAAHVSGIAALLLERSPRLAPAQVRDLLLATAHPVTESAGLAGPGLGLVDACAALAKLIGAAPCE